MSKSPCPVKAMEEKVEFLFRISQPSDIHRSNSHLELRSGGAGNSEVQTENGDEFWNKIGLKRYSSHYGPLRGQEPSIDGLRLSSPPPPIVPSLLQTVNILRLTIDCPDRELVAEAGRVLKQIEDAGFPIPRPLFTAPSCFIPPLKCPRVSVGSRCSNSAGDSTCDNLEQIGASTSGDVSLISGHTSSCDSINPTGNASSLTSKYAEAARLLSQAFLSSGRIDHAIQLMAYHEDYLEVFLRTHHFLLRGDGPLPFTYRHYIAIMAAARFQCTYLMELQKREFLYQGGDPLWLQGLEFAPQKLTSLYHINKMMAHRPWALRKEDFLNLTKKAGWSLSEAVHAVVLLAHFHSLSSFIHGCGITPEVDFDKGHQLDPVAFNVIGTGAGGGTSPLPGTGTTHGGGHGGTSDSISSAPASLLGDHPTSVTTSPTNKIDKTDTSTSPSPTNNKSSTGLLRTAAQMNSNNGGAAASLPTSPTNTSASPTPAKKAASEVELLLVTMKNLAETIPIEDPEERKKRFETVASSADDTHEKENVQSVPTIVNSMVPPEVSPFVSDPDFMYEDFAKRGLTDLHTFRIQDYSWQEHGFSLLNRLYADVGGYLDDKFRVAQHMTYNTMGGSNQVDTTKFRTAVWNYIQCLYGIRHDDYDYGEVNQLLERSLKSYIKTVCCYPERITKADYDNVMREFKHSEKVHVNLMIMEAKLQAELLYALRTIMKFIL